MYKLTALMMPTPSSANNFHTLDDLYGYNIVSNNAVAAGQSAHPLHIHIIPRYNGDVDNPKGGVRWVIAKMLLRNAEEKQHEIGKKTQV